MKKNNTVQKSQKNVHNLYHENKGIAILLFLLLPLFTCSCISKKASVNHSFGTKSDSTSSFQEISTTYSDAPFTIELPGDTVLSETNVDEGMNILSTPFSVSYAWVQNGKLEHKLEQRAIKTTGNIKTTIKKSSSTFNKHSTSGNSNTGRKINPILIYAMALLCICMIIQKRFIKHT